jgi:hypothetical protein
MGDSGKRFGMGWLPDYPDFRDYTAEHKEIKALKPMLFLKSSSKIGSSVDLRAWCSPVEDQGPLGSCTAHAGAGVVWSITIPGCSGNTLMRRALPL